MSNFSKRKFSEYMQERVSCWSDDNPCAPEDVLYGTNDKYLFNCDVCSHVFSKNIHTITQMNSWCPYCAGRKLCGDSECVMCFEKTFAFHEQEKSLHWSTSNKLLPHEVFSSCNKKFIFDCERCLHSFSKSPNSITSTNAWCGFCDNKALCGEDWCVICYEKTFEFKHPEKSLCWSSKNIKKPNEVFASTGVKYYFDCSECGHELHLSPHKISGRNRWCKYCTNQELCGSEDCNICYEKTFLCHEPEKSLCWSSKNKKTPDQVFRCANAKYIFDCDDCHEEFEMLLMNISRRGDWCTNCSPCSKYEEAIKTKLATLENTKTEKEETIYLNNRPLRWDFVVTTGSTRFYIEVDGSQHFNLANHMGISRTKDPIIGLEKFRDQRVRDHLKEDYIRRTNKLLFRVSYRQLKQIGTLVDKMISESESGRTGVVYMDSIYNDWEPIP